VREGAIPGGFSLGENLPFETAFDVCLHDFIKPVVRRHKPCFYDRSPQGFHVTTFARSLPRNTTARAVAFARPDVGLMVNVVTILVVLIALLAGAAWTHVT
jgi:hypothetical protein